MASRTVTMMIMRHIKNTGNVHVGVIKIAETPWDRQETRKKNTIFLSDVEGRAVSHIVMCFVGLQNIIRVKSGRK